MASLPKKPPPPPPNHGCPPPSPQKSPGPLVKPDPANIPHSFQEHHRHVLQLAMIVMACMVGVIMLLCTVSVLIRYFYSRRYSPNQNRRAAPILFDLNGDPPSSDNDDDVEEEPLAVVHPIWYIRTVGLQQSLIDSITVFKYKKDEGIIDGTECSVCLGEFEHDESLRLLPKCSHAFHIPCIDTWLASHKNCPLCRAPVVREGTEIRAVDQNNHTDSNVSDHQSLQNLEAGQVENSRDHERVEDDDGDGDGVSSSVVEVEVEEETQPLRRSVSMDSSSANSMVLFRDAVVDLDSTHYGEKVNSSGKDMSIEKHGNGSSTSTTINKLASIGRALQKKPVSMRRSFSHNTKFLFPRHSRSQSSTLPL